jgi:protocatechuate 3,4-dioxygenase, beta subunit
MTMEIGVTRRQVLHASIAASGLTMLGAPSFARAAEETYKWVLTEVTPSTVAGPFYPLASKPVDRDADLTTIQGRPTRAQGQVLYLMGQVLNIKGGPVKGVQVEIWQPNAGGRYDHPSDPNPVPLDPNFQGYGTTTTDAEGRYRFKTIKPGPYPVIQGWDRPPHIHFQLTGSADLLVTQMWFPDDPLNGQDRLFNNLRPAAQQMLTAKIQPPTGNQEPDSKVALFNIIVTNG